MSFFFTFFQLFLFFYLLKNVFKGSRHYSSVLISSVIALSDYIIINTSPINSISFSSTCLSISKYRSIISFQAAIRNWFAYLSKQSLLIQILITNKIKVKYFHIWSLLNCNCLIILYTYTFLDSSIL